MTIDYANDNHTLCARMLAIEWIDELDFDEMQIKNLWRRSNEMD